MPLMNRRDIQLILFSSLLLIISFPRIDQSFFFFFSLIPLLYAVEGKGVYRTFLLGWLCGFVFHIGLLYWIVVVTITYGKLVYPLGILVMLLLISYLSLYFGSALAIAMFIQKNRFSLGKSGIFSIPLTFTHPVCRYHRGIWHKLPHCICKCYPVFTV